MKNILLILCFFIITSLTACQKDMAREDIFPENGNTISVNYRQSSLYPDNLQQENTNEEFGYKRSQNNAVIGNNMSTDLFPSNERQQLANIISQNSAELQDVEDVSTLVTDEEVLVIYKTTAKDRNKTASQVKKIAMSIVPRWFHVYVSDNTSLRKELEFYSDQSVNSQDVQSNINKLVKQILNSPQGNSRE